MEQNQMEMAQAVVAMEGYLALAETHGIVRVLEEVAKYAKRGLAITPKVLATVLG